MKFLAIIANFTKIWMVKRFSNVNNVFFRRYSHPYAMGSVTNPFWSLVQYMLTCFIDKLIGATDL